MNMKRYAIIADLKQWREDFTDKDTGEVVSIKRKEISHYFLEEFKLPEDNEEAKIEIEKIINNFNNTLKPGEKPRVFIRFISKRQQKRIEDLHYDQKIISKITKRKN